MLKDAYCTVDEANALVNSSEWNALIADERNNALKWGRTYVDSKYLFVSVDTDDTDFQNALKVANALLGNYYAKGQLYTTSQTGEQVLVEKTVKAGSVSTSKRYAEGNVASSVDPFPDVTAVLAPYGSRISSAFLQATVIRA